MDETWPSLDETAAYVGLGKTALYSMAREGGIPARKVGKKWTFEKAGLDAWIRGHRPVQSFFTDIEFKIEGNGELRDPQLEGYLRTYADFSATGVHFDGEIYGAIGWLLRKTYLEHRHDTAELLADIVDGMNYTPATPTFEQMRDGILTAVIGDPDRTCHVWQAFATYGVGEGAKATVRRSRATIVESFTPPAACQ